MISQISGTPENRSSLKASWKSSVSHWSPLSSSSRCAHARKCLTVKALGLALGFRTGRTSATSPVGVSTTGGVGPRPRARGFGGSRRSARRAGLLGRRAPWLASDAVPARRADARRYSVPCNTPLRVVYGVGVLVGGGGSDTREEVARGHGHPTDLRRQGAPLPLRYAVDPSAIVFHHRRCCSDDMLAADHQDRGRQSSPDLCNLAGATRTTDLVPRQHAGGHDLHRTVGWGKGGASCHRPADRTDSAVPC